MWVNGKKRAVRRSEVQWRTLLEEFGGSDLSVGVFCARSGISPANYYRWRSWLKGLGARSGMALRPRVPAFIDAGVLERVTHCKTRVDLKLELGVGSGGNDGVYSPSRLCREHGN